MVRKTSQTAGMLLFQLASFTMLSGLPFCAFAQDNANEESDADVKELLNMSLEELSNVIVTSVSKTAEREKDAAAAIYVVSQEDIRKSGATTLPDLLRGVPGITVTQAGSHDWTVTSRGSNDQFSNKLLVLMDGRTIYSPLFSGVIWDVQDTMLEDIDRIEIIRGPGATLWGANAVNGVINIITKNAKDTVGGVASVVAGNQVKGIESVRYGGKIADNSYLRVYAKHTDYNSQFTPAGDSANDNWNKSQAGFRSDSKLSSDDKLTVQGDIYAIDEDSNYTIPDLTSATLTSNPEGTKAGGGNLLARWEHKHSKDSETTVQAYFDNTSYKTSFFNDLTNTADIDIQNVWKGWKRQEIVWGAGYRFINSQNDPSAQYALTPKTRNDNTFSGFVQDRITLSPKELFFTLGSKFEHNDYSGVEIQPSARLSWLPTKNQTVWGSVSRAVHTPYRFNSDGTQAGGVTVLPGPTVGYVSAVGNPDLKSEELIAYELGYRIQPTKSLSFDVATFYNVYDNLFYTYYGVPTATYLPIVGDNSGSGTSKGVELSTKWSISKEWQVSGGYSYIDEVFDKKNSVSVNYVGKTPKHQFNIRSIYTFPHKVEMTNALYYVDNLTGANINGYYRLDTRISYPITYDIDISLVGQNLLDNRHQEFSAFSYRNSEEIGRSVYANLKIKF
jgi:iron complex outermembrane receptor protein